jgi:uncharacterized protein involved in oxidation of intracellular sulfur
MKYLFILNDPPCGTEHCYNGLRHARALLKKEHGDTEVEVRVFLLGDASLCAKTDQKVPQGYYNIEVMLRGVIRSGGKVGVCSSCMDARGITDGELVEGTRRSTLDEMTVWADKVVTY